MIEKLFDGKIDTYIEILLKAGEDVRNGIFTVHEAATLYSVSPADLVKLIAEQNEYHAWLNREVQGRNVKYSD